MTDGHMVLTEYKSMPTSRCCLNSCPTFKQIRSEALCQSQVYHPLIRHLVVPVSHIVVVFICFTSVALLDYAGRLKSINHPLRLLIENEIFRLGVWTNPSNEARRGVDHLGTTERSMLDVSQLYRNTLRLL
jgi:hypothetical protein